MDKLTVDEVALNEVLKNLVDPWHKAFAKNVIEKYEEHRNKDPLRVAQILPNRVPGSYLVEINPPLEQANYTIKAEPLKELDATYPYCVHGIYTGNGEQCPRCLESINQPKT